MTTNDYEALSQISHKGCTCPRPHPHHFDALIAWADSRQPQPHVVSGVTGVTHGDYYAIQVEPCACQGWTERLVKHRDGTPVEGSLEVVSRSNHLRSCERASKPHVVECSEGAEVGVDWANGIVLHEGDDGWHPWDTEVYGPRPATQPTVHNHGTEDGPGLACNEIRLTDGRLLGACLLPQPTASEPTEVEVENLGRAEAERRGYPMPDGEADDQSGWTFVEGVHYGFALRAARGVSNDDNNKKENL